ncbi:MAG: conserved hypothetical exported protein [Gemmatimonadetes bacterium]|nr:conserved hypothetical exported protein [Gemmatimonadota bacterium]
MCTSCAARIDRLEHRARRDRRLALFALAATVVALVAPLRATPASAASGPRVASTDSVLRVRGLVVVDGQGHDRVFIGAPLPDPSLFGKRRSRGGNYSGILLLDANGDERSGYATTDSGQVMFTLDEVGRMVANFMAQPAGGVRLNLTDEFDNGIRLGTSREGPFLDFVKAGKSVAQLPGGSKLP